MCDELRRRRLRGVRPPDRLDSMLVERVGRGAFDFSFEPVNDTVATIINTVPIKQH